ncbi:MAG: DUF4465 domain-containing protein [Paludibacteraceae bacterium]|nr:DUF4465 domain-containing protein [Paludibacteraceae bacterium]
MKNLKKLAFWMAIAVAFAACSNEEPATVIDFETVSLGESGHTSEATPVVIGSVTFNTEEGNYDGFSYWNGGIVVSNLTDRETAGYANQYSVYAAAGANGSSNFGVIYYSSFAAGNSSIVFDQAVNIESVDFNNSTYTYLALKDGNDGGFGGVTAMAAGDWYKVTVTGKNGEETTGSVDFFLADFRDGKSFICNSWTTCSLSTLGTVTQLLFSVDGTDVGESGLNTPAYVCIDNLRFFAISGK